MAIALARRYRPKRFSDLVAQDHVAAVLRGAVASQRVGHGYLLTGPRGVGKTTAARILAMALNCEQRDLAPEPGEPCGVCGSCLKVWNGSANLDVVEIDAASNRGVEDARDLRERAMYAASREGGYKVYIVDEAHMLTREAWNALLKILEEPPPGVVFVFATTEPQKIAAQAAPVLSRLQRFDFRRIGPSAIRVRLEEVLAAEKIHADADALVLIANHADGGMRDALSLLDQCLSFGDGGVTAQRVREILGLVNDELYGELLAVVAERRPAGVFPLVERMLDAGADLGEFLNGAAEMLRALLMLQVGAEPAGITEQLRRTLVSYRDQFQPGDVLRMLRLLAAEESGVRRGPNPRLLVETLLLRWTLLDRLVDLEEVLAGGAAPSRTGAPARPATPAPVGAPGRIMRDAAPPASASSPAPVHPVGEAAPAVGPPNDPFDLAALRAAWPDIVVSVKEQSRFLGEALAATLPIVASAPDLTIRFLEENPMHLEAIGRQRALLERLLGERLGAPVRLRTEGPGPDSARGVSAGAPAKSKRLSEAATRAERLKAARSADPSVDAAASELDLEIVE